MRNDLQRHKKSDGIKWVLTCIAFLLIAVMLTCICLQIFGTDNLKPFEWFTKPSTEKPIPETLDENGEAPVIDENGNYLESGVVHEMPRAMIFSSVSSQVSDIKGVTLKAIVLPEFALNKSVDWTVEFVNSNDSWADGKNAIDYVTVSPISDGALTANVTCVKPFGSQIKIIVTSRSNRDAKAECMVDFARRLKSVSFTVGDTMGNDFGYTLSGENVSLNLKPILHPQAFYQKYGSLSSDLFYSYEYNFGGDYTIANSVKSEKFEIKASDELINALLSQGLTTNLSDWKVYKSPAYGDIIFDLGGSSLHNGYVLYTPAYNKLLAAFGATKSIDFQVRITSEMSFGGNVITMFNCHFDHSSVGFLAETVSINNDGIVF